MARQATLGAMIDALKKARDNRLERAKEWEAEEKELKATESDLRQRIIAALEKSKQTSGSSETATATITVKLLPRATDWPSIYKYIAKNDAWDLLERRIGKKAFADRLEQGEHVPGIDVFEEKDLSLTKA